MANEDVEPAGCSSDPFLVDLIRQQAAETTPAATLGFFVLKNRTLVFMARASVSKTEEAGSLPARPAKFQKWRYSSIG